MSEKNCLCGDEVCRLLKEKKPNNRKVNQLVRALDAEFGRLKRPLTPVDVSRIWDKVMKGV